MGAEGSRRASASRPARIIVALIVVATCAYFGIDLTGRGPVGPGISARTERPATGSGAVASTNAELLEAMRARRSGVMLTVRAEVLKVLADDRDGARHQRLLLAIDELDAAYDTLLVAHNIDLAPRVPARAGDTLTVRGQYEWNEKGGVIHWTHHDPGERREGGFIVHDGERYE